MDYETRAVAFIDVMGWENTVEASIRDTELRHRMQRALSALEIFLQEENDNEPLRGQLRTTPTADCATQFSDSVAISYLSDEPYHLGRLIRRVSDYQRIMLTAGFPVRGAITVGKLYHRGSIVFGPALNLVVGIEKRVAKYPRVVVDQSLQETVEELAKMYPPHWTFVRKDDDGLVMTDYLTHLALSNAITQELRDFIAERQKTYATDQDVLAKYGHLATALERAVADADWRRARHEELRNIMQRGTEPPAQA